MPGRLSLEFLGEVPVTLSLGDGYVKGDDVEAAPDAVVCPSHFGKPVGGQPELELRDELKVLAIEEASRYAVVL
jgi:hypothetical protein